MPDLTTALRAIDDVIQSGPFTDTWKSLQQYVIPAWYQDAKFGIFSHWGVYSVPAAQNEWYPRNMYQPGSSTWEHHRNVWGPQDTFGYKDFVPLFKAEKFDPAGWAELFAEAGARFYVPVAEHHDGFSMYDNSFTRWNAVKMGPKRDIIGELARATRERGMVFGASSHRAENWWFFDGGRTFPSDVQDPQYADLYGRAANKETSEKGSTAPDETHCADWLARTCELVDKYRPNIVWFDWWIEQPAFEPHRRKFAAYYYNRAHQWGEQVAINYKHKAFADGSAVFDVERGQLAEIRPQLWQTDTSVSKNSWCFITHNEYKPIPLLIHDLADIVSKNGALLLNIGPKADGTIAEIEQRMLREIGRWLKVNGEAIYGTRPWGTFGEGPTKVAGGSFTDGKRESFTAEDIRFTRKGDAVYAIVLGWPENGRVTVRSLATDSCFRPDPIRSVRLLGSEVPLKWTRHAGGLVVDLPTERPTDHAFALQIH